MAVSATFAPTRRRRLTVRTRVTLAATVVVAVALAVASIVVVMLLRAELVGSVAREAKVRAAELAALAATAPLADPLSPLIAPWPTLAQVVGPDGRVIASSVELQGRAPLVPVDAAHREVVREIHADLGRNAHIWRAESVPATLGGEPATVIVATAIDQFDHTARLLATLLALAVPVLVGIVAVVTWIVVGRALRAVDAMRRRVESVTAGAVPSVSFAEGDDEVGRLGHTLNVMVARLAAAHARQVQFAADASHELRSPLANMRVAVEVAKAHPEQADWPEVADDVLAQGQRMQELVDDLLLLARTGGDTPPSWREHVDLADVVAEVLARPAMVSAPIRCDALRPAVVRGGRAELTRVVTNLVDNALRYASSQVTVSVTAAGRWAELVVVDDGPGIPPGDRERVFERFVRLDDHRGRPAGGTGLGLAIVRELVVAHAGTVTVGDAHPGATFVVRLPRAGASASGAAS
jgi:signal transduction histidine kinase